MEFHWDKLPPEIQEMIVRLSGNQIAYEQVIERDIHMCGKVLRKGPKSLKDVWKLGRLYITNCHSIYGGYYDEEIRCISNGTSKELTDSKPHQTAK